jgi:hypothetical protein
MDLRKFHTRSIGKPPGRRGDRVLLERGADPLAPTLPHSSFHVAPALAGSAKTHGFTCTIVIRAHWREVGGCGDLRQTEPSSLRISEATLVLFFGILRTHRITNVLYKDINRNQWCGQV